jgi:hypothetical protein
VVEQLLESKKALACESLLSVPVTDADRIALETVGCVSRLARTICRPCWR